MTKKQSKPGAPRAARPEKPVTHVVRLEERERDFLASILHSDRLQVSGSGVELLAGLRKKFPAPKPPASSK